MMVKENLKYKDQPLDLEGASVSGNTIAEGEPGHDMPGLDKEPVKAVKKSNKTRKAVQDFLGGITSRKNG